MWHIKIEGSVLKQTGIAMPARKEEQEQLKLVVNGSGKKSFSSCPQRWTHRIVGIAAVLIIAIGQPLFCLDRGKQE